ncbi:hypothetical protein DFH06DRAFT_1319054 [Mycena polygramma]|nr:hypothetical protein DFH06DRAFT_1319054 [Mycena polygramma]
MDSNTCRDIVLYQSPGALSGDLTSQADVVGLDRVKQFRDRTLRQRALEEVEMQVCEYERAVTWFALTRPELSLGEKIEAMWPSGYHKAPALPSARVHRVFYDVHLAVLLSRAAQVARWNHAARRAEEAWVDYGWALHASTREQPMGERAEHLWRGETFAFDAFDRRIQPAAPRSDDFDVPDDTEGGASDVLTNVRRARRELGSARHFAVVHARGVRANAQKRKVLCALADKVREAVMVAFEMGMGHMVE